MSDSDSPYSHSFAQCASSPGKTSSSLILWLLPTSAAHTSLWALSFPSDSSTSSLSSQLSLEDLKCPKRMCTALRLCTPRPGLCHLAWTHPISFLWGPGCYPTQTLRRLDLTSSLLFTEIPSKSCLWFTCHWLRSKTLECGGLLPPSTPSPSSPPVPPSEWRQPHPHCSHLHLWCPNWHVLFSPLICYQPWSSKQSSPNMVEALALLCLEPFSPGPSRVKGRAFTVPSKICALHRQPGRGFPRHRPAGHPVTHSMHPLALPTYSSLCLECPGLASLGTYSRAFSDLFKCQTDTLCSLSPTWNPPQLSGCPLSTSHHLPHCMFLICLCPLEYVLHERRVAARAMRGALWMNEWIQCWLKKHKVRTSLPLYLE